MRTTREAKLELVPCEDDLCTNCVGTANAFCENDMSCVLNLLHLIKEKQYRIRIFACTDICITISMHRQIIFYDTFLFCFTDIDSTHRHLVRTNEVAPVIIKNCNEEYQHVTEFTEPIVYGRIAEHLPEHPLIKVEGVTKCVYMGVGEGRGVGGACHLQNTADVLNISVCSK